MKKNLLLLISGTVSFFLVMTFITLPIVFAGPIKLNYANFPPPKTFPSVQMDRWAKEIEKRTNGAVIIKTFPGGTLIGAKNIAKIRPLPLS